MNSANVMRDRIINGNENPVQVAPGNEVGIVNTTNIAPGVMNTLYQTADDHWTNNDIRVVLVDGAAVLGKKGPNTPVVGFACLHVHRVSTNNDECRTADGDGKGPVLPGALGGNGKGKCFVASFSTSEACFMPDGGEGISGTYTGVPLPPRLVQ